IPLMFAHWIFNRKTNAKKYIFFIGVLCCYILFTILINFKTQSVSDFFEVYKVLKFAIIVLFASAVFEKNKNLFHKTVCIALPALLFINLLHYFNVFGFNQVIEPFYAVSEIHLQYFGLDSLGNPSSKRMLGTAGNPNINGIVFLFFFVYFLSKLDPKKINQASWFVLMAVIGIVLCQSRTTLLATVVILGAAFYIRRLSWKSIGLNLLIIAIAGAGAFLLSSASLDYFANTHVQPTDNNSLRGRFEVWQYLSEMIMQKPIFGHGPHKQFFYQNDLYSESEYVLYAWRYGFIGALLYILWIIFPLFRNLRVAREHGFFILICLGILISAITNNPLANPMILSLFAIAAAHFYAEKSNNTNTVQ
ncbi:MAG: O-antigen ligase family protein, partial [Bacteroidales bacterium]|nr:O-antigen ligase family protein [Bacteroidales bacterium]